jgi:SSS family transporter
MSQILAVVIIVAYFGLLITVSLLTGKDDSNEAFFVGKKESPWYVVAFGMIGASLSGVTFISVPGWVATSLFSYMQMVLGYLAGYTVIALVLMPLYYRLNLTSIYGYLDQRFGFWSHKTGAFYFLLSRVIGASFRLYLVALAMHLAVFSPLGMPFWVAVLVAVILIWVYTFRSGIKTIIWTDTLQTSFMLLAVVATIFVIKDAMHWSFGQMLGEIAQSEYAQIFFVDDPNDGKFFLKQFLAGMFITISMTGLDQDMMQKNLSCKSLKEAQKNMFWFSAVLVVANLLFLSLGALLYMFAGEHGISADITGDKLYPYLALSGDLGSWAGVLFIVGLVAAAYSSADSALTALTTSFCVDFLGMEKKPSLSDRSTRKRVHIGFTLLLFVVIIVFEALNNDSVIAELFKVAGYTYGPLLGLFSFGLFSKRTIKDHWVPLIALLSPIAAYLLQRFDHILFNGYEIGFELLLINGALAFFGLFLVSASRNDAPALP